MNLIYSKGGSYSNETIQQFAKAYIIRFYNEKKLGESTGRQLFTSRHTYPPAKIVGDRSYSIVTDYLGTPTHAFDSNGTKVWERELDIYGRVKNGDGTFVPFRYQGQYFDEEIDLCYNRFRYYSPETGTYISQDPIGLAGNNPNIYAYVFDSNIEIDPFGLRKYIVYQAPELDAMGNPTGRIYTGRTSGADEMSVEQILAKRKSGHHRKDIGSLTSIYETDSYKAVRGGEQHYIEEARKSGKAVDQINGISPKKANKNGYEAAFANPENNKTGVLDNNVTKGHH